MLDAAARAAKGGNGMNILKEWQRMCATYKGCGRKGCPVTSCPRYFQLKNIDMDLLEREITEWARMHPPKTCLQDFQEKFPNMRLTIMPYPPIHPWDLGYDVPHDIKAQQAWDLPMEE